MVVTLTTLDQPLEVKAVGESTPHTQESSLPWQWTSVLVVPLEMLVVMWSIPVVISLILLPIGLVLASALWLARLILARF